MKTFHLAQETVAMSSERDFEAGTRSPMVAGGISVNEYVRRNNPSIFRGDAVGRPRVHLPSANPKYPETKHTTKCVHTVFSRSARDWPGASCQHDPRATS